MKGSLLVFILALCVSCAFADDCDFNIASTSDLDGVIANQNWGSTTKILCFAAGTYSYSDAPKYTITASQVWRGARANDDPTCNQRVNPPCSRLQSAKSFDDSVESVFVVSNAVSGTLFFMNSGTFNFSGFSVNFHTSAEPLAETDTLYLYNNYFLTQGAIIAHEIYAYYNYLDGAASSATLLEADTTTGEVKYNYFTNSNTAIGGSVDIIEYNSFVNNGLALSAAHSPILSNNLFLLNYVVASTTSSSTWESNSIIFNQEVIPIQTASYSLSTTGNCFLDNNELLTIANGDEITSGSDGDNYFGPSILVSGGFFDFGGGHLGWSPQNPFVFSSPLVCPKNFLSVFVLHSNNVIVGEPMDIYWTFKTGTSLIGSGLDLSTLNQTTVTFSFYDGSYSSSNDKITLKLNDTVYLSKFGVAYNSLTYTPQFTDFFSSPMHGRINNYTLVANINANFIAGGNPFSHTFVAAQGVKIAFNIPEECRERTDLAYVVSKTARFNGPVNVNLTDLFCDTVQWNISAINQQPLHAAPVSLNGNNGVTFTIAPDNSGIFTFVLNITSLSSPSAVHRLLARVDVVNTRPYVTPYRAFNYTQWSDVENVNLLFNSSDADSDTVTITHIYPRGDKNFTNIDDFSVYFHFPNSTGFVVVSDASGNLSIHDVDLTNPESPAVGGVFSGKFKSSFGLNFVASDGDRSNQHAEGAVIFHHVKASS